MPLEQLEGRAMKVYHEPTQPGPDEPWTVPMVERAMKLPGGMVPKDMRAARKRFRELIDMIPTVTVEGKSVKQDQASVDILTEAIRRLDEAIDAKGEKQ